MGQVGPHTAAPGATTLPDLCVGRLCDLVRADEFHSLGVVARHEPLAEVVEQNSALAACRVVEEHVGRGSGPDQPERVELHQFGTAQSGAGLDGEAEGVAGVLMAARGGTPPNAHVASGREDHGVGVHEIARAIGEAEPVGAENRPVVDQQPGDVHARQDGDAESPGAFPQSLPHLHANALAGHRGAAVHVVGESVRGRPVMALCSGQVSWRPIWRHLPPA